MKIYTRTGDKGETSLLGGKRLPKDHQRIEAYGTVDELNAHLGSLKDLAPTGYNDIITSIQNELFTIGSTLASAPDADLSKFKVPELTNASIERMEKQMDLWDKELPAMRNFILPGGNQAVSQAHIARCVCRRAERRAVHLASEESVPEVIIHYLNRLSDLLFVMARMLSQDLGSAEIPWRPNA